MEHLSSISTFSMVEVPSSPHPTPRQEHIDPTNPSTTPSAGSLVKTNTTLQIREIYLRMTHQKVIPSVPGVNLWPLSGRSTKKFSSIKRLKAI
jgi:hypothetical protein